MAGVHDLTRVLQTTSYFHVPSLVIINKADINPQGTEAIKAICSELGVELIGQIPFDETITEAMLNGNRSQHIDLMQLPAEHWLPSGKMFQLGWRRQENPMPDPESLRKNILERLARVIDPETGVDVMRMRLIEDLTVDEAGKVNYKFRPSSPLCPIALPLHSRSKRQSLKWQV